MKSSSELNVNGTIVRVIRHNGADYVCITDIAALRNPIEPKDVVKNWMRSRATISFLGLWEKLHNPDFKGVDFDPHLAMAGGNRRDYATINQLICISNMENINAVMTNENVPQKSEAFRREAAQRARRVSARAQRSGRKELRIPQPQRLKKLNEIAIQQMCILSEVEGRKYLK